jgi:hypothetical protein
MLGFASSGFTNSSMHAQIYVVLSIEHPFKCGTAFWACRAGTRCQCIMCWYVSGVMKIVGIWWTVWATIC